MVESPVKFPTKLETRLFLQEEGHEEDRRVVEYFADGWTIKSVLIVYKDGASSFTRFHSDGAVRDLVEFYPAGDDGKVPQLRRSIVYAAGGSNVMAAKFYREDGSLAANGQLRADGLYEQFEYDQKGIVVLSHSAFLPDGETVYLKSFSDSVADYVDGKIDGGIEYRVAFREDGTRRKKTYSFSESNSEVVEFFSPSGLSLSHIVFRYDKIGVVVFNEDGTLKEARKYDGDRLEVLVYRKGIRGSSGQSAQSGKTGPGFLNVPGQGIAYKQFWKGANGEEPVLTRLDKYRANGKVERKLHFDDRALDRVELLGPSGQVTKTVSPSATGAKESIDSTVFDYEEQDTELTDFHDPRTEVGPPVAPYYPYEGYYDDYEEHYGYPHGNPNGQYGPNGYPHDRSLNFP